MDLRNFKNLFKHQKVEDVAYEIAFATVIAAIALAAVMGSHQ